MSLEIAYPHIEKPEGLPARLHRLPRVRIAQIAIGYLAFGWSVDEMCRQHPCLAPAEAHTAMAYCFDHQAEIDQEIQAEWEESERQRLEPQFIPLHSKLKAKRQA